MIPELNQSGVLPPFIPEQGPTDPAGMAPYKTTITEFIHRYAHTFERRAILRGLLDYRRKLKSIGVRNGFQWLDGSFVEDVELNRGRPPSDVDIVTFALRPTNDLELWKKLVYENTDLFLPNEAKQKYCCDAYFVDLNTHPIHVVSNTRYWFGLFSHQRESYLWKGMVEIPIDCSDDEALEILDREAGNA
ncbi:hypothetical protein EKK97_09530 [Billgrantia tianxiuensis]|uniref:Uncharacterized protein n=1 Tax=Billgrantia tianxiuensis TaxID=2497861 RepID=A0A6I6SH16_9GAMM|nr:MULTISPECIES: hypothetical protein [Halomonas]MCE8032182.1 hypothetical protein [Halomonas sp. MCCC 1A11057]QHC49799.1 hypothetical protein EKK97_09530 [Halomonas tianxiuensis]